MAYVVAEFERRYRQQYGFLMPGRALVIEAVAVEHRKPRRVVSW